MQNIKETVDKIASLQEGDLDKLIELDAMGLLVAPGETLQQYKERQTELFRNLEQIYSELEDNGTVTLFDWITLEKDRRIPPEIMEEAAAINDSYYGFKINWVPGFFLSHSLGFLWGGCSISIPEENLSIFLIRANFAKQKRWLIYRRDELISHELCHIARLPMRDRSFEELFAYRSSPSGFRRYMGNCFQYSIDAILFIVPFFLLLLAQICQQFLHLTWLPIYPFWILALSYPVFLMIRNQVIRNHFFKAKKKLERAGVENPMALLFRSTKTEIIEISKSYDIQSYIDSKAPSELRWKIIDSRFNSH